MSESKFLLLVGPSGVGKSTLIGALQKISSRYVYISPYTNRPLRNGETDKISISDTKMNRMMDDGELLVINEKFGWRYATPRSTILDAFETCNYPVLDWPVDKLSIMRNAFKGKLFVVYVTPPSLEELERRLAKDGRDHNGVRLQSAKSELALYYAGEFTSLFNFEVVNDGKVTDLALQIHTAYLQSLE